MYKNVGRKIKGFSIFLAWLIVAAASMLAFYRLFENNSFDAVSIAISVGIIIAGIALAILLSWFIYGFGVIVQSAEKTSEEIESISYLLCNIDSIIAQKGASPKPNANAQNNQQENIPISTFKLPDTREELYASQLRKLKKDYEMSRITFDEYEQGKKLLEQKYK